MNLLVQVSTRNSNFTLSKSLIPAQHKTTKAADNLKKNAESKTGRQFLPILTHLRNTE